MAINFKELTETFLAEADEDLGKMEQALLLLETNPEDPELIKTLFRAAHTLKGNGLALGFAPIAELSHSAEDLLAHVRSETIAADRAVVTLLFSAVDALRGLLKEAASGNCTLSDQHRALMRELSKPRAPRPPGTPLSLAAARPTPSMAAKPPTPSMAAKAPPKPSHAPPPPAPEPPEPTLAPGTAPAVPASTGAEDALPRTLRGSGRDPNRRPTLTLREKPPGAADTAPRSDRRTTTTHIAPDVRARTLRVDVTKLDELLNIAGEIAIARGRLTDMVEKLGEPAKDILEAHLDSDRLYSALQDLVMKTRMVPVGGLLRQFGRLVRDLSEAKGKHVRLVIEGEDVEVDTAVVEHLRDPLTHMIRNAIDHGIEPPAIRKAKNKSAEGTLVLRAFHEGGSLVVQVADDGRGLDRRRILEKAVLRGIVSEQASLADREILELIFLPGFSTAEAVTEISGRGVGMDVVRRNVEAIRGTVAVFSREGEGTTLSLTLPLTLAIIQGFLVGVAGDTFVVPVDSVLECIELGADSRRRGIATGVTNLRGEALPWVRLRDLFGAPAEELPRENLLVVRRPGGRAGIVVDQIHGERQIVIKPLGKLFQRVRGVAGSAILGSGRVALILDVATLLRDVMGQHMDSEAGSQEGRQVSP